MTKRKKNAGDLAVFGGTPCFESIMHVGRPNIGNRQALFTRIDEALDRNRLTNNGPFVQELEKRFADYLGVKHCIATCNATVALQITFRALGLREKVIVPSFSFIATVHALEWLGIKAVFCDIDQKTHNIDPVQVERLITPDTTGIIGVHLWGRPCDIYELQKIADRHKIVLILDASHAFGCSHNRKMIGSFGRAEVFSFHATKFINSFEGGAVVTNDDDLAGKIRLMKDHGFSGMDNVISVGINGRMSEISAAMGLTSFESIDRIVQINRANYKKYEEGFESIPGITLHKYDETEKCNYQYITALIDDRFPLERDELLKVLHGERVKVRRYFYPGCHRMEPYASMPEYTGLSLPETELVAERVLVFPTGTAIDDTVIERLFELLEFISRNGTAIKKRLINTAD